MPPLAEIRELLEPQMKAVAAGAPDAVDAPEASGESDEADEAAQAEVRVNLRSLAQVRQWPQRTRKGRGHNLRRGTTALGQLGNSPDLKDQHRAKTW